MTSKILVLICAFLFFQCEVFSQIIDRLKKPVKQVDHTKMKQVDQTKRCNVILSNGKAYDSNPRDIDSRADVWNIPSYRDAKIVKSGNDYDVFFPNTMYNGHLLTFNETIGSIYNYYPAYDHFPVDTLRAHGLPIYKSDTSHAICYIKVQTPTALFRDGIKKQSNFFELSNMSSNDVPIGSFYDVSVYSFRGSGKFLEQQFKVYLKTCSETNVRRCQ